MIKEKSKTWQHLSALLGKFFFTYLPFSAGFYTCMSLVLALAAVFCAYTHYFILSIFLFLFAGLFDLVDGAVARFSQKASNLGAFFDGTTDRFVDFFIIYSYFFFHITPFWFNLPQLIYITFFVVIMPTFIVAYANHRGAVNDDEETLIWRLMNRGEMFIIMIGVLVVSLFNPNWAGYLLIGLIVLSVMTIIQTMGETIYHART